MGAWLLQHIDWIAKHCKCNVTAEGSTSTSSLVGSGIDPGPQRQPVTRPSSAGGAAKRPATMLANFSPPTSPCQNHDAAWLQSLNADVRTDYKIHSVADPAHTHVVMEFKTPKGLGIRRPGPVPPSTKQNRAAPGSVAYELGQLTTDTGVPGGEQFGALKQLVTQMLHYCAPCGVLFDGIDFVFCSLRRDTSLNGEVDSKVAVVRYYVCRYSDEGDMPTFHQCLHHLIAEAKELRPVWTVIRMELMNLLNCGQEQACLPALASPLWCAQRVGLLLLPLCIAVHVCT
jgi:hypothetical protein